MFIDELTIKVKAGDGGNGIISFRREAFVPKGGPDGGDGGDGGNVYLVADSSINNLFDLKQNKIYKAQRGKDGQSKKKTGAKGKDLYLKVPLGTIIYDANTNKLIADLKEDNQIILVAKGGKGGRGNFRFRDSVHKAPRFAEKGQKGEQKTLLLKLKFIAQVGIIGLPNAGKSTFLKVISNANPKIAPYPFTTLYPQLGRVKMFDSYLITFADIPGLIEGASKGHGLGIRFLKHIERTKILLHLVDISLISNLQDIIKNIKIIRKELKNFSKQLLKKREIIALNKIDSANIDENLIIDLLEKNSIAKKEDIFFISNFTKEGIDKLLTYIYNIIINLKDKAETQDLPEDETYKEYKIEKIYIEKKENEVKVYGKSIKDIIDRFDFSQQDALMYFNKRLKHIGFFKYLTKNSVKEGDLINIYNLYFYYSDRKLIWKEVEDNEYRTN